MIDVLTSPTPMERSAEAQAKLDAATSAMSLYQFETCPFCIKVRRAIKRLALKIEIRDAKKPAIWEVLVREGGQDQVPCLRIVEKDGKVTWMYESSDINAYLEKLANA